jgi:hypothetical protein
VLLVLALYGLYNFIRKQAIKGKKKLRLNNASVLNESVNKNNEDIIKGFTNNTINKKRNEIILII